MKMKYLRWASLAVVFVLVSLGLILDTNLGTLSSFGWQAVAAICPLGVIESMLAGKSVFLRALIVLVVVVGAVVALGKFFCSWICPVAPIRSFRELLARTLERGGKKARIKPAETAEETLGATPATAKAAAALCPSSCSACAASGVTKRKRPRIDSRHIILGGSLLSAALFGIPVFCLLCPLGLLFGTVIVVWQFFGVGDASLSLLIYPLLLVLELLVFSKWCTKLCPMGALLSLISLTNRFFRPAVDSARCLRAQGSFCTVCNTVCPEGLDPHSTQGVHECTKCGRCKDSCPSGAITFAVFASRSAQLPRPLRSRHSSARPPRDPSE